jgi:IS30 family transposase
VVGFVAPLDRLVVRQISSRYLSQDERIEIADLGQSGLIVRTIAGQLGRAPSTISRELRRNAVTGRGYRPFDAHRRDTVRRARRHRRRIDINSELSGVVAELLVQRWSPQQISRHLRLRFVDDPSMWLCHESIHQAVYQPNSRFLRPSRLAPHRPHRCAPVVITAEPVSASSAGGRGLSSQCSPSTTGRSRLTTDPRPGMGRAI